MHIIVCSYSLKQLKLPGCWLMLRIQLIGFSMTSGEAPCDGLDACCKSHDDCVEQSGMLANKCHSAFVQCMRKEEKRNRNGFSQKVKLTKQAQKQSPLSMCKHVTLIDCSI